MSFIWFLIVGLIAGALARLLVPGPDRLSLLGTLVLGVIGSFVGGIIFNLFGEGSIFELRTTGIIGSTLGAVIALLVYRRMQRRTG
ncbi:MAG: GlsB/YeaQ/YmgE family stress response membrane protein [Acidimicrobiia bacterium]|jgi:uncharacterized membrane protein YeaQ/YmgE (transglycosylase-associated protein family)